MKKKSIVTYNKWKIIFWFFLFSIIVTALVYGPEYGINQKFVVLITLVLGIFTEIFAGIISLIALIPFFGPFIRGFRRNFFGSKRAPKNLKANLREIPIGLLFFAF